MRVWLWCLCCWAKERAWGDRHGLGERGHDCECGRGCHCLSTISPSIISLGSSRGSQDLPLTMEGCEVR